MTGGPKRSSRFAKNKVSFSMAAEKVELMQECFPKTLAHGNSKNEIRRTDEEGKKRGVSMEKSKAGTKKKSQEPTCCSHAEVFGKTPLHEFHSSSIAMPNRTCFFALLVSTLFWLGIAIKPNTIIIIIIIMENLTISYESFTLVQKSDRLFRTDKLLKQSIGQLLVAADHNQLRTMASETVDTIDWPLLRTLMGSTL